MSGENSSRDIVVELINSVPVVPVLVIVIGAVMFILGSSTILFEKGAVFTDFAGRVALMGVGGTAFIFGIVWAVITSKLIGKYGIKITEKKERQTKEGTELDIGGTVGRRLPKGYALWIMRVYGDNSLLPLKDVYIKPGEQKWEATKCSIGSASWMVAFLVGPVGRDFIKYFKDAASRHNKWMDDLNVDKSVPQRYLPNIEKPTTDMIECDRIKI